VGFCGAVMSVGFRPGDYILDTILFTVHSERKKAVLCTRYSKHASHKFSLSTLVTLRASSVHLIGKTCIGILTAKLKTA